MDKSRVQGAVDQVVGSAKRHVGNLTGDTRTEVEGAVQQIKGKVETAVGKVKDAGRDVRDHAVAANEEQREKREVELAENHNLL
jgi:uncharacterized protein YjbJ (UPF0337 family)